MKLTEPELISQGAEAVRQSNTICCNEVLPRKSFHSSLPFPQKIYRGVYQGRIAIAKLRFPKTYRHPSLDKKLTRERTKKVWFQSFLPSLTQPGSFFLSRKTYHVQTEKCFLFSAPDLDLDLDPDPYIGGKSLDQMWEVGGSSTRIAAYRQRSKSSIYGAITCVHSHTLTPLCTLLHLECTLLYTLKYPRLPWYPQTLMNPRLPLYATLF